jgi:A/G-specific adenine glycosylase
VSPSDGPALGPLRSALLDWYDGEHRDFPWRRTRDPYAVLVSEVMLQQTQATRVAAAFPRFLARFPTAASLASAPQAQVLAAWSGLGYNRRALALQRAAAAVTAHGWPRAVSDLERLPGIGPYTARAAASLAFGEPVGVVETNVRRWLIRRFGLAVDARPAELQRLADALAVAGDDRRADAWTHASMEFGAAVCTARRPHCAACPIADGCPSLGTAGAVPMPPRPPFAGSDRAHRGRLMRALSRRSGHALSVADARRAIAGADFERIVAGLERDGLVHRSAGRLRLGGRGPAGPAATIDP